jgi:alkylated DNA repair dioxygenase AlkB
VASSPAPAPTLTWQTSLLGDGAPGFDASARGLHLELTDGAWVDHVPGWLRGADTLFAQLVAAVPWRYHEIPMYDRVVPQPRLSAWWDEDRTSWPAPTSALADALTARYGETFAFLGANLYRDGRDSVAWHGDRVHRDQDQALVAVVTLGATRRFLLRPRRGGPSVRLEPAAGDLLVMGGTCQRTWQHAVPKSARVTGPRLSITLRPRRPVGTR